eukprot:gene13197-15591_t
MAFFSSSPARVSMRVLDSALQRSVGVGSGLPSQALLAAVPMRTQLCALSNSHAVAAIRSSDNHDNVLTYIHAHLFDNVSPDDNAKHSASSASQYDQLRVMTAYDNVTFAACGYHHGAYIIVVVTGK